MFVRSGQELFSQTADKLIHVAHICHHNEQISCSLPNETKDQRTFWKPRTTYSPLQHQVWSLSGTFLKLYLTCNRLPEATPLTSCVKAEQRKADYTDPSGDDKLNCSIDRPLSILLHPIQTENVTSRDVRQMCRLSFSPDRATIFFLCSSQAWGCLSGLSGRPAMPASAWSHDLWLQHRHTIACAQ